MKKAYREKTENVYAMVDCRYSQHIFPKTAAMTNTSVTMKDVPPMTNTSVTMK